MISILGHKKMQKIRTVETILGMGGGRIKENDRGVNSSMICCKNF
jgi:hypothetical protein